jgi:hypothetical protein
MCSRSINSAACQPHDQTISSLCRRLRSRHGLYFRLVAFSTYVKSFSDPVEFPGNLPPLPKIGAALPLPFELVQLPCRGKVALILVDRLLLLAHNWRRL